jgi:hypothetical protein
MELKLGERVWRHFNDRPTVRIHGFDENTEVETKGFFRFVVKSF